MDTKQTMVNNLRQLPVSDVTRARASYMGTDLSSKQQAKHLVQIVQSSQANKTQQPNKEVSFNNNTPQQLYREPFSILCTPHTTRTAHRTSTSTVPRKLLTIFIALISSSRGFLYVLGMLALS